MESIISKLDKWLTDKCKDLTIPQEERIIYSKVLDKLEQLYELQDNV